MGREGTRRRNTDGNPYLAGVDLLVWVFLRAILERKDLWVLDHTVANLDRFPEVTSVSQASGPTMTVGR